MAKLFYVLAQTRRGDNICGWFDTDLCEVVDDNGKGAYLLRDLKKIQTSISPICSEQEGVV